MRTKLTICTAEETMSLKVDFSGQLLPSHMSELKTKGYMSVINNRPDNEEAGQPSSADIEVAAREAGLGYIHQPVVSGQITEYDAECFARHYHEVHKPLMMFCRSGGRSNTLYQMAQNMGLLDAESH